MITQFFTAPATGNAVPIPAPPAGFTDLVVDLAGVSHDSPANSTLRVEAFDGAAWSPPLAIASFNNTLPYGARLVFGNCGESIGSYERIQLGSAPSLNVNLARVGWQVNGGIQGLRISLSSGNFDAGTITASVR